MYRNLNVGRVLGEVIYSIRLKGIVCLHSPLVELKDATFRASRGSSNSYGWEGVRSTGRKNVHAGVSGNFTAATSTEGLGEFLSDDSWSVVGYDPRRDSGFMLLDKLTREPSSPVYSAQTVMCAMEQRDGRLRSLVIARGVK